VAITIWVISTGVITIEIPLFIKNIKKSALEDLASQIFLLNRNLMELLRDFPRIKMSQTMAIKTETSK
tara:strand:+ start:384 stop:587 length:204 start_codon:yes stop_codon:yes gene_type:complete